MGGGSLNLLLVAVFAAAAGCATGGSGSAEDWQPPVDVSVGEGGPDSGQRHDAGPGRPIDARAPVIDGPASAPDEGAGTPDGGAGAPDVASTDVAEEAVPADATAGADAEPESGALEAGAQDVATSSDICPFDPAYAAEATSAIFSGRPTVCPDGVCPVGQCCYDQILPVSVCVPE
jgi:hypothetical protein